MLRIPRLLQSLVGSIFAATALIGLPGCASKPLAAPTPITSVVTSVRITGPARPAPGATPVHYSAVAEFSDGTTQEITAEAKWALLGFTSWFTSPGNVVFAGRGQATISASYRGVAGQLVVSVLESGTFILTGGVNQADGSPLDGATVDVRAGIGTGISAYSDSAGRYALYGVAGRIQIGISRGGFATEVRDVVVTADTSTEALTLAPVVPSGSLAGTWTLTVTPAPGCGAGLPDRARGRPYSVQFLGVPSQFFVKTFGPTVEVYNVATDPGSMSGSAIQWTFVGDTNYGDWSWANIIDHLSSTENFQFDGQVTGIVSGDEIRGTLDGDLSYWNDQIFSQTPTWYCRASDHVVVLKR